ncbi:uncharacterized protein LOC111319619 [Stylophora pistillata]|uniref:uncharacterized protein LOC111319619 n=1 Tax=Stylophora pistillata TaxID=50429 RepID=UPI000C04C21F|nr:uncharacterized protein LOC111319619 [Stylophora pistillata]
MTWMSRATHLCPPGDFLHVARLGGYYPLKYYKHCDHVVGITQGLVNHLSKGHWSPSQIHYIQNFAFLPKKVSPIVRSEFQTPKSAPLILALGRLHSDKAFDILIPALAKIPKAYLWIAGEGEEREALERLARFEGVEDRVRFLGWQTRTACLIQAADILAFPSRIEPHGTVTLEAWGYQKPLVVARSAGPGEMVRHGETGLLVDIDDIESLSASLNRVIQDKDLTKKMVQKGYEEFLSKYTEEIVVKKYLDFFETICRQKKKGR